MPPALPPDHTRLGGIDWLEATNGSLSGAEKRRLMARVARSQAQGLTGRLKLLSGRRPDAPEPIPTPPNSVLARAAEDACGLQERVLVAHAYRTWAFGRALASVDGEGRIDEDVDMALAYTHFSATVCGYLCPNL